MYSSKVTYNCVWMLCEVAMDRRWCVLHLYFVKVEDEVQLADVAKVAVQQLDKEVDALQQSKLVVTHIHAQRKVEASVAPVDYFVGAELSGGGR